MILNRINIARPYAVAAFEYALAKSALSAWEDILIQSAKIAEQEACVAFLKGPTITKQQQLDLFCDCLKSNLDKEQKNFLHLLAENKRLLVLPEIAKLFVELHAQYEKIASVVVYSALPLTSEYKELLVKRLMQRFQQKISLTCEVQPFLIGGIKVRAGDVVIDGTVRNTLNRLLESL